MSMADELEPAEEDAEAAILVARLRHAGAGDVGRAAAAIQPKY